MYDYGGTLDSACYCNDPGADHSGKQLSDELLIVSWKGFPEGAASYQTLDRKWKGESGTLHRQISGIFIAIFSIKLFGKN